MRKAASTGELLPALAQREGVKGGNVSLPDGKTQNHRWTELERDPRDHLIQLLRTGN